jgi:hypothetical protein
MHYEKHLRTKAYLEELVRLGMGVVEYARTRNISSPRSSQIFKKFGLTANVRATLRTNELIECADEYISAQSGVPISP